MGFLQINPASTATAIMALLLLAMVHQGGGQPQPGQLAQCLANCSQRGITCPIQCGAAAVLDSLPCMTGCATNEISCLTGCMAGVNPPAGV